MTANPDKIFLSKVVRVLGGLGIWQHVRKITDVVRLDDHYVVIARLESGFPLMFDCYDNGIINLRLWDKAHVEILGERNKDDVTISMICKLLELLSKKKKERDRLLPILSFYIAIAEYNALNNIEMSAIDKIKMRSDIQSIFFKMDGHGMTSLYKDLLKKFKYIIL